MRNWAINSSNQYELSNESDKIYTFRTESGILYQLIFADSSALLVSHQGLFGFFEFSFEPIENQLDRRSLFDEKIRNTIESLLFQFFENPDNILYYICDSSDNRQLARERLFKRWFADLQPLPIEQLTVSLSSELKIIILIHKSFPFPKQLREALMESEEFYASQK